MLGDNETEELALENSPLTAKDKAMRGADVAPVTVCAPVAPAAAIDFVDTV